MKEIKFKVWDKKRKEFTDEQDGAELIFMLEDNELGYISEWANGTSHPTVDKNRFEMLQFTGLKDKNGKYIYEGDILREPLNTLKLKYGFNYSVVFDYGEFVAKTRRDSTTLVLKSHRFFECEVIGNIYENPKLLKTKNETTLKLCKECMSMTNHIDDQNIWICGKCAHMREEW